TEVNKVMETARNDKAIGASLEAKVLLYVPDETLQQELELFNNCDSLTGNKVDELRYLFLSSQVELVSDISAIQTAEYKGESDFVSVGIVKADGEKCDRCWNYSTQVGKFADDPTICERCNAALKGEF
ncbi:MAG: zinc finger domain-containing protein, partial [Microcystis aeruginosa]